MLFVYAPREIEQSRRSLTKRTNVISFLKKVLAFQITLSIWVVGWSKHKILRNTCNIQLVKETAKQFFGILPVALPLTFDPEGLEKKENIKSQSSRDYIIVTCHWVLVPI
jgi:hypothetical protein